jgi:type VI secretion system secreted protein Hcp
MAIDMFLIIDTVKGETTDKDFSKKTAIDVLAWGWGISQSGTTHMGGGGGSGKASFQDIQVTKYVDSSTHALMGGCATGEHFATASLHVRKAGKTQHEYITIEMKEVIITSISTGGSGGEDRLTENISLNFAEVKFTYKPQKPDGSLGDALPFTYNIAASDAA